MANEVIHYTTVSSLLGEDAELIEALGFPEISALDETSKKAETTLRAKIKVLLEDPEPDSRMWLHRRKVKGPVEVDSVEIVFEPIRRSIDWRRPVTLSVPFVRWTEGELYHGYAPCLGIRVFAPRASLLGERIEQHFKLLMGAAKGRRTLRYLAHVSRFTEIQLGQGEASVHLKTLKQLATSTRTEEKAVTTLPKVAEELPPIQTRTDLERPTSAAAVPPAAVEMESELAYIAEEWQRARPTSLLLIGPQGCGKTALVHEFARRRAEFGFATTPIWSSSGARLMSGDIGFGMWQEQCRKVCQEIAKTKAILHLSSLAELLEVGKASAGQQSVGGFLRPAIARGEILVVSECTPEQLSVLERQEPHLLAAFRQFQIAARSPAQTRMILGRLLKEAPGEQLNAGETKSNELALDWIQRLHQRYAAYSANPARPSRFLRNLLADRFPKKTITEADVTAAFCRETGLPGVLVDDRIALDLDATRDWFAKKVTGQSEAVDQVVDLLAGIKARLAAPFKPLASFLFIGPTGTGKTEMAKTLAEFLFGDAGRLARFDLNEFGNAITVQRLIGSAVLGADEGLLTARIREQPFSVILLDEFEKADPSFFDLLLQMLGDGRLTDAAGRLADFTNCVIIMTSNLGAQSYQTGALGFRSNSDAAGAREHFMSAVRKFLRPEIYNRIDAIVPFLPLDLNSVKSIAEAQLQKIGRRDGLALRPVALSIDPRVAEFLARRGHDPRYGARPLKRVIERELLAPLSEELNKFSEDLPIDCEIALVDEQLRFRARGRQPGSEGPSAPEAIAADSELVASIISERRVMSRLRNSTSVSVLENRLDMLESLERRRSKKAANAPGRSERQAAIGRLRSCIAAAGTALKRIEEAETEAATDIFRRAALDRELFMSELTALKSERRRCQRDVFRLIQTDPEDVVLGFYAEKRAVVLSFAAAYLAIAEQSGEVVALEYFAPPPGGRSGNVKLARATPKSIQEFFEKPPEHLIGVVMHFRGDLFFPRFEPESGIHAVETEGGIDACLIETKRPPLKEYRPPAGVEQPGFISARKKSYRRHFVRGRRVAIDLHLGERPWLQGNIDFCVETLMDEFLEKRIEEIA